MRASKRITLDLIPKSKVPVTFHQKPGECTVGSNHGEAGLGLKWAEPDKGGQTHLLHTHTLKHNRPLQATISVAAEQTRGWEGGQLSFVMVIIPLSCIFYFVVN